MMEFGDLTEDDFMAYNSARHHYIPQYLIRAFTNSKGMLYVYDKAKDKISKHARPPKSVFYEFDRNTLDLNEKGKTSVVEDRMFSVVDQQLSQVVKYFQKTELELLSFDITNTAHMLVLAINLFWRVPANDELVLSLLRRSDIRINGMSSEQIKEDPVYQKLLRFGLNGETIKEIVKQSRGGTEVVNVHQFGIPAFVLGDNPVLYKSNPNRFNELGSTSFMVALSSNRIYTATENSLKLTQVNVMRYNAAVIQQSKRYVVSENKNLLQSSARLFRHIESNGASDYLKTRAFRMD